MGVRFLQAYFIKFADEARSDAESRVADRREMKEDERYDFYLAGESDEAALRALLRDNPVSGGICLSFQREPDFFSAARSGYKLCQVITAKDKKDGSLCGTGTRAIFDSYINGIKCQTGYLSNLRVAKEHRNAYGLFKGYRYFHSLHSDMKAKIYITTIVEGNDRAGKLLTSRRGSLPCYHDYGLYMSNAVFLNRKRRPHKGRYEVSRASPGMIDDVLDCMHRNGSAKQFYPHYSAEDFLPGEGSFKNLSISDIYTASHGGKIVGIAAKWDQRSFKQLVVTDYKGIARAVKPFYDLIAPRLLRAPPLPKRGSAFNLFCVSFVAIENNDYGIFKEILETIYSDNIGTGYDYFLVGLHSTDPLLSALKGFPHICYKSRVYVACWEDGKEYFRALDGRIPYLEIGIL